MAPKWKDGSRSIWMHSSSSQKSFTEGMPPSGPDDAIGDNGTEPGSAVVEFTFLSLLLMVPPASIGRVIHLSNPADNYQFRF